MDEQFERDQLARAITSELAYGTYRWKELDQSNEPCIDMMRSLHPAWGMASNEALRRYAWLRWPRMKDQAATLRILAEFVPLARLAYPQARARFAAIDAEAARAPSYCWSARVMAETEQSLLRTCAERTTQVPCARLGVAIAWYRAAKGRPPAQLADLVPEFLGEVPLSALTGRPFDYEVSGDSARLWDGVNEASRACDSWYFGDRSRFPESR